MFTLAQTKVLPKVLSFSEVKFYILSATFVSLAVFVPWLTHQFHIAGPKFLPMHFFVIIAGFLFGWRTGLVVGIFSPLISYSITHLPPLALLPEITLELALYGLAIGILREKKLNIFIVLFSAMIFGRLARLLFALALGVETYPLHYFQISWPGIVLQIISIPIIIFLLQKYIFEKSNERSL